MGASGNFRKLVIVESPNKCEKIKGYLNSVYPGEFEVLATVGHIRDLGHGGFENLGYTVPDFKGMYTISEDKKRVAFNIRNAAKSCEHVYIATDLDREGEAIAWHVKVVLGLKDHEYDRVKFSEITKKGVLDGIANPMKIDMCLVAAQETRRLLDRCIGFGLHGIVHDAVRFLSSVGRVQTPALRLIVEKEIAIRDFVPTDYYELSSNFKQGWSAKWNPKANPKFGLTAWTKPGEDYVTDKAMVEELKGKVTDLTVAAVVNDVAISKPPKPFITASLQKAAFTQLGFYPKDTMDFAQELFVGGYITYHRTDSLNLSEEAIEEMKAYGVKEDIKVVGRKWESGDLAQEAHEAIRPTSIFTTQIETTNPKVQKLYELIWNRTICSQLEEAKYDTREVRLEQMVFVHIDGELEQKKVAFYARSRKLKYKGWLAFLEAKKIDLSDEQQEKEEKDEEVSMANNPIPDDLKEGDVINPLEVVMKKCTTTVPKRYNQASLVTALESLGIGRPSTYASILLKLYDRNFIYEEKKKIHADEKGIKLIETVLNQFSFVEYKYTAKLEKALDLIAHGQLDWKETMAEFHETTLNVEREIFKRNTLANIPLHECPEEKCDGRLMPRIHFGKDKHTNKMVARPYWRCNSAGCGHSMQDVNGVPGIRWHKTLTDHVCIACNTHKVIHVTGLDDDGKTKTYYRCAGSNKNDQPQCGVYFKEHDGQPNFKLWQLDHTYTCRECNGFLRHQIWQKDGREGRAFFCENSENKKNPCKAFYPMIKGELVPDYEAYEKKKSEAPVETLIDGAVAPCAKKGCKGKLNKFNIFNKKTDKRYFQWKCPTCKTRYWGNEEDDEVGKALG